MMALNGTCTVMLLLGELNSVVFDMAIRKPPAALYTYWFHVCLEIPLYVMLSMMRSTSKYIVLSNGAMPVALMKILVPFVVLLKRFPMFVARDVRLNRASEGPTPGENAIGDSFFPDVWL